MPNQYEGKRAEELARKFLEEKGCKDVSFEYRGPEEKIVNGVLYPEESYWKLYGPYKINGVEKRFCVLVDYQLTKVMEYDLDYKKY